MEQGQQAMLFLNRRGYAGFVSCRSCGHVIKCPHCDVSLSLHSNGRLVCHYCGHQEQGTSLCPECGSPFLRSFRAGTQQIEEEVRRQFPTARVLRMDLDTTKGKEGHQEILAAFANQEADILIGTQMIVKGHDFPHVTVMGVLAADVSLHVPDYRAGERTFQLLTQAAGRAGRGEQPGRVIIQTYDPEHYAVQAAAKQDYEGFFEQEMRYRSLAGYPPAGSLLAIHCSCGDEAYLRMACSYLTQYLKRAAAGMQVQILGPADETIAKIQDQYRMVLYLKADQEQLLRTVKNKMERYVAVNQGFDAIQIQIDVD